MITGRENTIVCPRLWGREHWGKWLSFLDHIIYHLLLGHFNNISLYIAWIVIFIILIQLFWFLKFIFRDWKDLVGELSGARSSLLYLRRLIFFKVILSILLSNFIMLMHEIFRAFSGSDFDKSQRGLTLKNRISTPSLLDFLRFFETKCVQFLFFCWGVECSTMSKRYFTILCRLFCFLLSLHLEELFLVKLGYVCHDSHFHVQFLLDSLILVEIYDEFGSWIIEHILLIFIWILRYFKCSNLGLKIVLRWQSLPSHELDMLQWPFLNRWLIELRLLCSYWLVVIKIHNWII